ncbi:MAG: threonine synthase [Dehalococcoidia bacterium]|nr:threonine synthase [Dehalococcoidia bacterium]
MSFARSLRCRQCKREYPLEPLFVCEFCFGSLEVVYDYEAISQSLTQESIAAGPKNIWRYRALLPVEDEPINMDAGFTPLFQAHNLGRALGLERLHIKNDCMNPTWSFKDRVVAVAVSKAREFGFQAVACASTGNLANSVAAHAARAGMRAFIFVPHDLEQGKILGTAIYGPILVAVRGNYDQVNRLCSELAERFPWAFVNINIRPYYAEGSKTLAYEVAEQLGWQAPDAVVVPVASGSLLTKVWKGLHELSQLGIIGRVGSRLFAAQAQGCSPIATAFETGKPVRPVKPDTIAKSLAIGNPADGFFVLNILRESGGRAVAVSDDEIVDGMKLLAETEGVFAETAGGVTVASLKRLAAQGAIKPDELTVALITASGLKTIEAVQEKVAPPITVDPTVTSFEQEVGERAFWTPPPKDTGRTDHG